MSGTPRVQGMCEVAGGCFGGQLRPDPDRRIGVGEENRAERDRARAGRDQLDRIESRVTPPMPTSGKSTAAEQA